MQSSPTTRIRPNAAASNERPSEPNNESTVGLRVVATIATERDLAIVSELAPSFLEWQCRMIAGVMRGAIYLASTDGKLGKCCAQWPNQGDTAEVLQEMASKAFATGQSELASSLTYTKNKGQVCDAVACPILHNEQVVGVISVALAKRALPQQNAVLQLLEWGVNWFGTLLTRESKSMQHRSPVLLDLLTLSLKQTSLEELAQCAVKTLVDRTDCDRVNIAITKGVRLRLLAVSGIEEFDHRARFATRIEDAMEEAGDQERAIQFPTHQNNTAVITRAHQRLADANPNKELYTRVAINKNMRVGIVIETDRQQKPDPSQLEIFDNAATLLAEAAVLIDAASGSITSRISHRLKQTTKHLGGRFGAWVALLTLLTGLATIIPATHRVTADAELRSFEQRAVVASISGYIESSHVRPGDDVKEGDLLAALDTRDLQLELNKWQGLRGARLVEYQEALAKRDRTQISILRARLDQIDAEMALVNGQISRAELRAPYAGVIVSGDLSQALDAPVKQGEVLFEIAPFAGYQVTVEVSEYDISTIHPGETGKLRLASMPHTVLPIVIDRIMPVAVAGSGRSHFRVEARLLEAPPELRPGMRGVAKISVDRKNLLWVWSHTIVDRMRLFFWSIGF